MRDAGGQGGRSPGGPGPGVIAKRLAQPCHQRTQHPSRVIVTPHHSHDSLACEGRHPEGRGTCGRAHSWGLRCPASSTCPHPAPPARPSPRPPAPPTDPPAACAAGVSKARFTSTAPRAASQRSAPKHILATPPPGFICLFGSLIISTGSADVIPGIHAAPRSPSDRQLQRRKKEVACSQPKEFINVPQITRCL